MINTAQIEATLRPGLQAVFGNYAQYPDQWTEIFKITSSDKNYEVDLEMRFLGAADIKPEGAPTPTDPGMSQRFLTYYRPVNVSQSFNITLEAQQDQLYESQFPTSAVQLKNSLRFTKNVLGANVLNNAFNPAYPTGDGQAMCSTSHPIDGGVYANTFDNNNPAVDFSEAGIEAAIIAVQKFKLQSGLLAQTMAQKLIVPRELQFEASRILDSAFRVNTANNDINALYHNDYIQQGYKVNQFLTNPNAWFVLTDAPDGLKHIKRTDITTSTYVDPVSFNIRCSAMERYAFGVSNCRAIFGSQGV